MKITHALAASDLNPSYASCIPVFIRTWLGLFGGRIRPVVVLLADELPAQWHAYRDYVRLFPPLSGISTAFQAQCIRLLYPAIVDLGRGTADQAEGVLITDIDIVPMNAAFYEQRAGLAAAAPDRFHFVSFNAEDKRPLGQVQICYNAATPAAWGEIFGIRSPADIGRQLETWHASLPCYDGRPGHAGWYSDQEFLFAALTAWLGRDERNTLTLLNAERVLERLDRTHLAGFSPLDGYRQLPTSVQDRIRAGFYTDFHMVRATGACTLSDSVIDLLLTPVTPPDRESTDEEEMEQARPDCGTELNNGQADRRGAPMHENRRKLVQTHWIGRFGNRMFQHAFCCQYSALYGVMYYPPSEWEGTHLFEPFADLAIIDDDQLRLEVNQTHPALDTAEYRRSAVSRYNERTGDEVVMLQDGDGMRAQLGLPNVALDSLHMMYDPHLLGMMDPAFVRNLFSFNVAVKRSELYRFLERKKGTYAVAHVRRGDINWDNFSGAHSVVSLESYHEAFAAHGDRKEDVFFLSDDPSIHDAYRRLEIPRSILDETRLEDSWMYPYGQRHLDDELFFSFLPDFLILHFARKIYRGNSAFSWWGGFLSDAEILSPVLNRKPPELQSRKFVQHCRFVRGNHPHFMGSPDEFGNLNLGSLQSVKGGT